jgi:hypothetical protein
MMEMTSPPVARHAANARSSHMFGLPTSQDSQCLQLPTVWWEFSAQHAPGTQWHFPAKLPKNAAYHS